MLAPANKYQITPSSLEFFSLGQTDIFTVIKVLIQLRWNRQEDNEEVVPYTHRSVYMANAVFPFKHTHTHAAHPSHLVWMD